MKRSVEYGSCRPAAAQVGRVGASSSFSMSIAWRAIRGREFGELAIEAAMRSSQWASRRATRLSSDSVVGEAATRRDTRAHAGIVAV